MIKYFEVTGTEYEMGYSVGNEFKEYLKESINKYEEKLKIKNVYNKVKNMEEKLKKTISKMFRRNIWKSGWSKYFKRCYTTYVFSRDI